VKTTFLAFALAGIVLAGCGGPSVPPTPSTIVIDKMAYGPVPGSLHVGDTLIWRNQDVLQHSATARDGSFDVDLPPGTSRRMLLARAGTINVYCRYHPDMKLRLLVEPRG
jgi:plastocyanin